MHAIAGATFNRGFNRALGSLLAGVFAVVVIQVAVACGPIAEPYVIGLSIFLIGMLNLALTKILSYLSVLLEILNHMLGLTLPACMTHILLLNYQTPQ